MKITQDEENGKTISALGLVVSAHPDPAGFPMVEVTTTPEFVGRIVVDGNEVVNELPPEPVWDEEAARKEANVATRSSIQALAATAFQAWFAANPNATKAEIAKQAAKIGAQAAFTTLNPGVAE